MDSNQEAANLAQIKQSRIAFWQLIVTIVLGIPTMGSIFGSLKNDKAFVSLGTLPLDCRKAVSFPRLLQNL
jgi:hypothetical protein